MDCTRGRFEFFTSCHFSPPLYFEKIKSGFVQTQIVFVCSWQSKLTMEGKSVMPMHTSPFGVKEEVQLKYLNSDYVKYA
jgi:hypothetical protein